MVPFYFKETLHADPAEGNAQLFFSLTGAEWTDEMVFLEEGNAAEETPGASDYDIQRLLSPLYHAYKKRPPKLFLLQGRAMGSHSVHALENIPKGTVVAEYLGEWTPSRSGVSAYRWGPIDGRNRRNIGPMIEDGFPNVAPFHLYHSGNVPKRVVFAALEDISKDEIIAVDYGMNHSVKIQYHAEYRLNQMMGFMAKNCLQKMVRRIKELQRQSIRDLKWKGVLEFQNLSSKLGYLFHTPSALFMILLENPALKNELSELFFNPECRYYLLGFSFRETYRQKEVADCIRLIFDYMERGLPHPAKDRELCLKLRQRVFCKVFLRGVLAGEERTSLEKEAWIWNEAFDAIQRGDRTLAAFKMEQSSQAEKLIQEGCFYANEIQSPLLPWLQTLTEPPIPLSPTG